MRDSKQRPEKRLDAYDPLAALRSFAEKRVPSARERERQYVSAEEVSGAFYELQVQKIELEMQNEELSRAKAELIASRARFFDLYNRVPVACLTIGPKGLIAEANLSAAVLFGTNPDLLLNRPFSSFIDAKDRQIYYAHRRLLFKTGQRQTSELRMLKRGEKMFWARLESAVSRDEDEPSVSHLVLWDISELKQAEEERRASEARVRHLNDVLRTMREVGRVINREKDPLKLLNAVCESLVKMRGYVVVWVGRPEVDSDRLVPIAHSGGDGRHLKELCIAWKECETTQGPVATAIREHTPAVLGDISGDQGCGAWKKWAAAGGVASIASFPLIQQEKLLGVLTVGADRPHAFDAEEVCLLQDLGADIAHGLQSIEDEMARLQAEREVSVQKDILQNIFENAPYTMMLLDKEGRVLEINRAGLAFCGKPKEQIAGLQGGEIFDCIKSSHGLECAKNPQCGDCSLLAAVTHTFETGKSVYNGEGHLTIRRGACQIGVDVLLSTTLVDDQICKAVLLSLIDVTERKKTADALRENEQRLQMFIEHAPVHLAIFDREMRFLKVSRKWLEDYDFSHRDLSGRSLYEVLPEIGEKWKSFHRRALGGEVLRMEEDRFERAGGNVQWLRWEVRPWFDGAKNIGGIVVFSEDITELRNAREFLRIERDLALKLGATADMAEAMGNLLEACLEFEGLDSGGVYLVDDQAKAMRLVCHRGIGKEEGISAVGAIPVECKGKTVAQINLASHVLPEIPESIRLWLENIAAHIGGVVERLKLAETIKTQKEELRDANAALKMLLT
jgi:PAS domain S-box-containing protein